jgi:hypothetical protein
MSLVLAIVSTYNFSIIVNKAYSYIKNELPDFTYENGQVTFEKSVEGYDKDLDLYSIIDTDSEMSDTTKNNYEEKVKDYSYAIIFLSDEVIVRESGEFNSFVYTDFEDIYNISVSNKADLENTIDNIGLVGINATYFIAAVLSLYIANILTYISDVLMVGIFGYLVAKMTRVPLTFAKSFVLAVYSLTLSIVLSTIYSVVYSLTGFVIQYFDIMYLVLAYIYMIAAILIIKSDVIKQKIELQQIYKVEKEVKQELEEQKDKDNQEENKDEEKEKDEKDKDKDDDEPIINREPDGSEI